MRFFFFFVIIILGHCVGNAQDNKVVSQILRNLNIGCDFNKSDSLQEFAFSINVFVDINAGEVDSFNVIGKLPASCNLARSEYLARENMSFKKRINNRQIDWQTWAASYGHKGCKNIVLVFPHILGTYAVKGELGTTFYKDFVVHYYLMPWAQDQCTIMFSPVVSRTLFTVF